MYGNNRTLVKSLCLKVIQVTATVSKPWVTSWLLPQFWSSYTDDTIFWWDATNYKLAPKQSEHSWKIIACTLSSIWVVVDSSIAITVYCIGRRNLLLHGRTVLCAGKFTEWRTHTEEGEGNFVESVRHMRRSTVRCKEEQTFCDSNYYFGYATELSNLYPLVEDIEIPKLTFL